MCEGRATSPCGRAGRRSPGPYGMTSRSRAKRNPRLSRSFALPEAVALANSPLSPTRSAYAQPVAVEEASSFALATASSTSPGAARVG
jgi:hypothetical protein